MINNNKFKYFLPTKIHFEKGGLKFLSTYVKERKALLLTSKGFIDRGLIDKIKSDCNFVEIFHKIPTHPDFNDIEQLYNITRKLKPQVIVALGGGSVMDVAKFVSVSGTEDTSFEYVSFITRKKIKNPKYKTIPIISIPTTSGTSSEITPWATIWDNLEKKKYSLHLAELFSETAIYDPELTLTLPKKITIQTGLDVLSHSLESIWNKNASSITIAHAVTASKIVINNLFELSMNLENIELRQEMMRASIHAGLSFSNTQTAIAHAMSYYITNYHGVPHGIACSFTLPMIIDQIIGKYKYIDCALEEIFGELSSKPIRNLFRSLEISTNMIDYGIDDDEFKKLVSSINNEQRTSNSLVKI